MKKLATLSAAIALVATFSAPVQAGAVHDASLFTSILAGNDDGSTGVVNLGFTLNFFGLNTGTAYVNNNGNITFDAALGTYTPFGLSTTNRQILAPFFADVDTRPVASTDVSYGAAMLGGKNVFGVNWINVGYFANRTDKLNSFQLIITDRSDLSAGDFDFEFNYDSITWETGEASGGSLGLGGDSARAGWSNGNAATFEFTGSAVDGSLLNGGANALVRGSLNSNVAGRYVFNVRNGVVVDPVSVPEPGSLLLVAAALVGAGVASRKARRA